MAILVAFACIGAMTPPADAAKSARAPQSAKKRHAKPKFVRSASDEGTAERDRRLLRECQGRPNAGACLGYTR